MHRSLAVILILIVVSPLAFTPHTLGYAHVPMPASDQHAPPETGPQDSFSSTETVQLLKATTLSGSFRISNFAH